MWYILSIFLTFSSFLQTLKNEVIKKRSDDNLYLSRKANLIFLQQLENYIIKGQSLVEEKRGPFLRTFGYGFYSKLRKTDVWCEKAVSTMASRVYFNMSLAAFFIKLTAVSNIGFGCQSQLTSRLALRLAVRGREGR